MRTTATKRLLVGLVAGLLLQATVSTAHAGSSDLAWIVPVAILGAALVTVLVVGAVNESKKNEKPGGRPRRGSLRAAGSAQAHDAGAEGRVVWDFRRCPRENGPVLVCW